MKTSIKALVLVIAVALVVTACILTGCTGGGDGTETTEGVTTGAEGTTAGETTGDETTAQGTEAEITTSKPVEPVSFDESTPALHTKNATLNLSIGQDAVTVESLKTTGGFEYVTTPVKLTLPDVGEKFTKKSVKEYTGERTTKGIVVAFESESFTYDQYIVSSGNFSGPFEFYGILTNKTSGKKSVSNGSYFDFTAKFDTIPTASTFRKESGVAEGWKIYSGQYYAGTGIYKTRLGNAKDNPSSTGTSAKFEVSNRSALYFWSGLHEKSEFTITFYVKGTAGDKLAYALEAAHATIDGVWQPAVNYDCSGEYTIKESNKWEKVTIKFTPANKAGIDGKGKTWNEDHAAAGFPFFIYTNNELAKNPLWIDDVSLNGQIQTFDGGTAAEGWPFGSWIPDGNVNIDVGGHTDESGADTAGFASVTAAYTTNQNWNAGGDISMMYLDTGKQGLYVAQEWSNGKIKATGATNDRAVLNVIIGNGNFSTSLPAGKSMLFPSVYIGVYDGDIEDGSNLYKRWFLNEKAPANMIANPNEPLTQQDMQTGTAVAQYGIQSLKWDYGWWTDDKSQNTFKDHEGQIEVKNSAYLQQLGRNAGKWRTLNEFTDKLRKTDVNGQPLTLATYVLLKDTRLDQAGVPTSVGANGHPEWFSDKIVTVCPSADLGNEDCVKFYQKYLYDFFKPTSEGGMGVTTWRSDFEPICSTSNKTNRHASNGSDVQYWCTVGFGELVDYLIDNIEGFRYESCSSGGSMKDIFTMTKASVINCDDSADYMSLHMSFYDSSYAMHPAQLQLPINSLTYCKGSGNYTGCADQMYGLRCQITGGVMLSNWGGTNSQWPSNSKETDKWKTVIAVDYNTRIKPLIREGDLYHILPRPDGKNWDGLEYVNLNVASKDDCACLMLWKPKGAANSKLIKLRGLDPDATYSLEFTDHKKLDTKLTGKELMEQGLTVTFTEAVSSDVIFLKRA